MGLDLARYDNDIKDPSAAAHVDGEYADGEKLEVDFVPALFINDKLYDGEMTAQALAAAIDPLLQ